MTSLTEYQPYLVNVLTAYFISWAGYGFAEPHDARIDFNISKKK